MQPEERPEKAVSERHMEMYLANPLWDFELVKTDLYHAQDMDSGNWALEHSEEEALQRLKAKCPEAVNVRCQRVSIRKRRQSGPATSKQEE